MRKGEAESRNAAAQPSAFFEREDLEHELSADACERREIKAKRKEKKTTKRDERARDRRPCSHEGLTVALRALVQGASSGVPDAVKANKEPEAALAAGRASPTALADAQVPHAQPDCKPHALAFEVTHALAVDFSKESGSPSRSPTALAHKPPPRDLADWRKA